jgi:hypothetical protein
MLAARILLIHTVKNASPAFLKKEITLNKPLRQIALK